MVIESIDETVNGMKGENLTEDRRVLIDYTDIDGRCGGTLEGPGDGNVWLGWGIWVS